MRDYAFPIQGFGRVPAPKDRAFAPVGVGLSVEPPGGVQLVSSPTPIPCKAGYSWVNAYPPDPSSPHVPELTNALVKYIRGWAGMYPSKAASDGSFYFRMVSSGMPLMYSPGFGNVNVCMKREFSSASGGLPTPGGVVDLGPTPPMTFSPALTNLNALNMNASTAAPTSYTWLWVLLGLGAAGVAGYYLLD